jgi:hypothetical protein
MLHNLSESDVKAVYRVNELPSALARARAGWAKSKDVIEIPEGTLPTWFETTLRNGKLPKGGELKDGKPNRAGGGKKI